MAVGDLDRLAATTPDTRNRVVDLLRAVAIVVVVLGHWLLAAVVVRDGELVPNAVLDLATWTHPFTWVFQVMPVFFLVGGYANGLSWRSARRRGEPYADWLAARVRRLGSPVVPLLLLWLAAVSVAYALGAPGALLRTASQVALVPTWFLAAYVLVVGCAPAFLALWERFGWWSVAGLLALGGAVDAVSIATRNELAGFPNYLLVWGAVHQLGFAWLDGRLPGLRSRLVLAVTGLAGLVALVWAGPYPIAMIGVDTAELNNSYPTRVTLGFLGLFQSGLVLVLEPVLARWLRRPRPWRATIAVNSRVMTLYLWHLTAMDLVIGASLLLGGPGLHAEPLSLTWWVTRPVWWAVLLAVTGVALLLLGRFEAVPDRAYRKVPAGVAVLACLLVCGGLGVMAKEGIVSSEGVRWVWPLLPVVGVALVRRTARAEPLTAR